MCAGIESSLSPVASPGGEEGGGGGVRRKVGANARSFAVAAQ